MKKLTTNPLFSTNVDAEEMYASVLVDLYSVYTDESIDGDTRVDKIFEILGHLEYMADLMGLIEETK